MKQNKFYELNETAAKLYQKNLILKENQKVLDYLYSRGLTEKEIIEFGIGFSPFNKTFLANNMINIGEKYSDLMESNLINLDKNNEYYDFFRNRIMFPIKNSNGNIVGFSGRAMSQKELKAKVGLIIDNARNYQIKINKFVTFQKQAFLILFLNLKKNQKYI
ncbi:MAG: hypothetical protein ACRCW6_03095 [Mycoplasmoidaceae bacterium]